MLKVCIEASVVSCEGLVAEETWEGRCTFLASWSEISSSLLVLLLLMLVDASVISILFSICVLKVSEEIGGNDATRRLMLYTLC